MTEVTNIHVSVGQLYINLPFVMAVFIQTFPYLSLYLTSYNHTWTCLILDMSTVCPTVTT